MKKMLAVVTVIMCMVATTPVFARDYGRGGHHYSQRGHYNYGHRDHHRSGLGIAFGLAGGLLLGSALAYSAAPPPRTVVYGAPYPVYQPEVVVQQQRICTEDRAVSGEWQISNGRQVWMQFPYPVTQRVQVPCY